MTDYLGFLYRITANIYKKKRDIFFFLQLILSRTCLIKRWASTSEVFLRPCESFTDAKLGKEPISGNYYFVFYNAEILKIYLYS